jgi:hypothetical protein
MLAYCQSIRENNYAYYKKHLYIMFNKIIVSLFNIAFNTFTTLEWNFHFYRRW